VQNATGFRDHYANCAVGTVSQLRPALPNSLISRYLNAAAHAAISGAVSARDNTDSSSRKKRKGTVMLSWSLIFLVVALVAAVLGFGVIAGTAATIAKILFTIFLILFLVSLITGRRSA
jgi:uncharacterized membrane protein YtjA (UPF0391 family)